MVARKRVCIAGRLFSAAGILLLGPQLALADEGGGPSRVMEASSPERAQSPTPTDPQARARAEILNSDAMLEALIWWDEYFAATAEDDEKEREELEARIANMSAVELRKFLLKFQRDRARARERQAAFDRSRQRLFAYRDSYLQEQQAASRAALKRAHYGDRRYFGTTHGHFAGPAPVPIRHDRAVRPPLITSLSVARYAVHRSIFGRLW